jgi:hypothetical protein
MKNLRMAFYPHGNLMELNGIFIHGTQSSIAARWRGDLRHRLHLLLLCGGSWGTTTRSFHFLHLHLHLPHHLLRFLQMEDVVQNLMTRYVQGMNVVLFIIGVVGVGERGVLGVEMEI